MRGSQAEVEPGRTQRTDHSASEPADRKAPKLAPCSLSLAKRETIAFKVGEHSPMLKAIKPRPR